MEENIKKVSVIVPTYEMYGKGVAFLKLNLDSIVAQETKPYEVVIPDNSDDNLIEEFVKGYTDKLNIVYFRNPIKGMSANTNAGIRAATGDIVKILYMDDRFANTKAIEVLTKAFTDNTVWVATGCLHDENGAVVRPHMPSYNKDIYAGNNTIGSPSVIAFLKTCNVFLDENMQWLLDCDFYARMYKVYGEPKFVYSCDVVIGLGQHQTTNALSDALKEHERQVMLHKII